jgi:ABC-type branched-subunit amino acid transport system substrate-binding protein
MLAAVAAGVLAMVQTRAWAGAEIVVGQIAPLTGVLATTGAQMVLGGKVYFDYINATGGVNGRKIKTRAR